MTIYFDMDGTIANLYAVDGWLTMLRAYDPAPYAQAEVMVNMSRLAWYLNRIQEAGIDIGIISWGSKVSTDEYDEAVADEKESWLGLHLHSVEWNEIHIVRYGTPKESFCTSENDILFDDEERHRDNWPGKAYDPSQIFEILRAVLHGE